MRIAVMQPYIFPYLGYFQLIHAADKFVFYDDVDFITRGWINRNKILIQGSDHLFTIPVKDASQNRLIKDTELAFSDRQKKKLLKKIHHAYAGASHYEEIYPLVSGVLESEYDSIAELCIRSVAETCVYLGIETEFIVSSQTYDNRDLGKADRLIDIAQKEGCDTYINAMGGRDIYEKEYFRKKGIDLYFLIPGAPEYNQQIDTFIPNLSIIDVMMFNAKADIGEMLDRYELQ